ncbi:MAG TPA: TonB-dependent receptor, partial [Bacteroidia bacterium]|nr:TonB-dependent receptor [Bacteroidia bacterium]
MKKFLQKALLFLPIFLVFPAFSQTGSISGVLLDKSNNGEVMPGVLVLLDTAGKNVKMTDFDGKYEFRNIPVGKYTLTFKMLTYATVVIPDVEVTNGKTEVVNVTMEQAAITKGEIVIKSVHTTNTEVGVIKEMENSNQVASGIGGAQIAKGSDPTAADAVKRVPGVTIIDNRFIMVRGLNERYNNVWLNDAGAPSAEVDKRAFSFDMVPSGVLDRIMIYKTPSADLPADFAGGMVKIYTKAFPDEPKLNVTLQGSYRTATTFQPFTNTPGSSTDRWGFDDGSRNIPHEIDAYISKNNYDETNLFHNDWVMATKNAAPDGRFSMMYATPISFGDSCGWTAGNTFGLSYSHAFTTYSIRREDWDSTAQIADYTDAQYTETVRSSAVENFSLMNKNGHIKIEYKNLFNQVGKNSSTIRESNYLDGPNERSYMMGYESRTIYSTQLATVLKSKKENSVYSVTLGHAYTERNAPDLRRIKYSKQRTDPDSMYMASVANIVDP